MGIEDSTERTEKDSGTVTANNGEWRIIDVINNIEYRQVSMDTFQLRNPTEIVTINAEGFNAWRESTESFAKWMGEYGVFAESRVDI